MIYLRCSRIDLDKLRFTQLIIQDKVEAIDARKAQSDELSNEPPRSSHRRPQYARPILCQTGVGIRIDFDC